MNYQRRQKAKMSSFGLIHKETALKTSMVRWSLTRLHNIHYPSIQNLQWKLIPLMEYLEERELIMTSNPSYSVVAKTSPKEKPSDYYDYVRTDML